jgi:hypothetical protein
VILEIVMRGRSRSKHGVACLAHDPRIHAAAKRQSVFGGFVSRRVTMDHRVKPVVTRRKSVST